MSLHPLLVGIAHADGLPRQEILACRANRDEIVPFLLEILHRAAAGNPLAEDEDLALFMVIHLLAEFGEPAAFVPLVTFLKSDSERVDHALGDAVTGTLDRVLVSTFDGDVAALESVIEDVAVDEFVRSAALKAWTLLAAIGRIDRDHANRYLHDAARQLQPQEDHYVWVAWMEASAYLGFSDLKEEVRAAYDDGRIDPIAAKFEHFEDHLQDALAAPDLPSLMERDGYGRFTDCIAEFSTWHGFMSEAEREQRDREWKERLRTRELASRPSATVINPQRHVGRNDPCPCGSGKKFKKCCGA
jgi:hypothetical protein